MKKGLTRNEREVLFGLVKYPTLNDRELSEKTSVKHSTITAIRRRLHQAGYFKTVRIPAVNRLGYELTVVGYGRYNPSASEDLKRQFVEAMAKENRGLYYFLNSPDFFFFISASKNYTSFRRWAEAIEYDFAETKLFVNSDRTYVVLPFEITKQLRHFDYSRTLSLPFGIKEKITLDAPFQKVDSRKLTKKERSVFAGLVEYPELTDVALSEKIDASRQVISSMKKRFERSGFVKTIRVVDLRMLGYEIYGFVHVMFDPKAPLKMRSEGIMRLARSAPMFFNLSGNTETVFCCAFRNYDEYFRIRKDIMSFYARREFIRGEPRVELIALSEAEILVNCDFSNLAREAASNLPK
ncbi:MAG: MarR family transcriptional regulator [Thermoplasmata archaeon]